MIWIGGDEKKERRKEKKKGGEKTRRGKKTKTKQVHVLDVFPKEWRDESRFDRSFYLFLKSMECGSGKTRSSLKVSIFTDIDTYMCIQTIKESHGDDAKKAIICTRQSSNEL